MDFNQFIIVGRVGKRPTLSKTPAGFDTCKLMLITNINYKKSNGEKMSDSEVNYIQFFEERAEKLCVFAEVGQEILVKGRVKTDEEKGKGVILRGEEFQFGPKKVKTPSISLFK